MELTEGSGQAEELSGLESWFTLPGQPLRPLPQWKMAIATYLGVVPVIMFLSLTLGRLIQIGISSSTTLSSTPLWWRS